MKLLDMTIKQLADEVTVEEFPEGSSRPQDNQGKRQKNQAPYTTLWRLTLHRKRNRLLTRLARNILMEPIHNKREGTQSIFGKLPLRRQYRIRLRYLQLTRSTPQRSLYHTFLRQANSRRRWKQSFQSGTTMSSPQNSQNKSSHYSQ